MLQFVLAFRSKRFEVIERHARSRYKNRFSRREDPPPLADTLLVPSVTRRPLLSLTNGDGWLLPRSDYWRSSYLVSAIDIGQLRGQELFCQMMPFQFLTRFFSLFVIEGTSGWKKRVRLVILRLRYINKIIFFSFILRDILYLKII